MEFLKEGQLVVSENESATTGVGHGKTTGASYEGECEGCEDARIGIIWSDGLLKYPCCNREMQYDSETDSWVMKANIPYCKHDPGAGISGVIFSF